MEREVMGTFVSELITKDQDDPLRFAVFNSGGSQNLVMFEIEDISIYVLNPNNGSSFPPRTK